MKRKKPRTFLAYAALLALCAAAETQAEAQAVAPPPAENAKSAEAARWREVYATDLAFIGDTLSANYIYARYPGGAAWKAQIDPALAQAAAAKVDSEAAYRAALSRFASSFRDAHLGVRFEGKPAPAFWPSFTVRYTGSRYVVDTTQRTDVKAGDAVTACDGRSLNDLIDLQAAFRNRVAGLESTRAALAPTVLVDDGNPLLARPAGCTIAGKSIKLDWSPMPPEAASGRRTIDLPAGISDFGSDAAWIRIPAMSPSTDAQAAALHDIIASTSLRDRKTIVFNVRGNPGGTYNWFVAILKSLYGEPCAAYYARERLRIVPVILQPAQPTTPKPQSGAAPAPPADRFNTPGDPDLDRVLSKPRFEKLPDGKQLMFVGAQNERDRERPDGPPPPNPVKAKVYVLTDSGCGSACLSFLDELLQFPGVTQIGLETGVDMRSGTPVSYRLPSGKGELHAPNMVRDKRTRGDNVPWTPKIRYDGDDITDTKAVQAWIRKSVIPPGGQ